MTSSESCLVAFFENFIELDEAEETLVCALEEITRKFPAKQTVYSAGEEQEHLFVVQSGWAYTTRYLQDGRRQVLQIHVPGDLVGIPDIAFAKATCTLRTLTECALCPFPRDKLTTIFSQSPKLGGFLYSVAMVERAILLDRATSLGRMSARERLAHFLLELMVRLKVTNPSMEHRYSLPLTQELIGDATGLTSVYVSRSLSKLEEEGLIKRFGGELELVGAEHLAEMCGFENRWKKLQTQWFTE